MSYIQNIEGVQMGTATVKFFIFFLWMLRIQCTPISVYVTQTHQSWEQSSNSCTLASNITSVYWDDITKPALSWIGGDKVHQNMWLNMTGCFVGTNITGDTIPEIEDPVQYCYQYCNNTQEFYLSSTSCLCGKFAMTTGCRADICQNKGNEQCGDDDGDCFCGYQIILTSVDEYNENLKCMAIERYSGNKFIYTPNNCSDNNSVLCTSKDGSAVVITNSIWAHAADHCTSRQNFIGVANNTVVNTNEDGPIWIGIFRVKQTFCTAIRITKELNYTLVPRDCKDNLTALCINSKLSSTTKTLNHTVSNQIPTSVAKNINVSTWPLHKPQSTVETLWSQGKTEFSTTSHSKTPPTSWTRSKIWSSTTTLSKPQAFANTQTKSSSSTSTLSKPHAFANTQTKNSHTNSDSMPTTTLDPIHLESTSKKTGDKQISPKPFPTLPVIGGAIGAIILVTVMCLIGIFRRRYRNSKEKSNNPHIISPYYNGNDVRLTGDSRGNGEVNIDEGKDDGGRGISKVKMSSDRQNAGYGHLDLDDTLSKQDRHKLISHQSGSYSDVRGNNGGTDINTKRDREYDSFTSNVKMEKSSLCQEDNYDHMARHHKNRGPVRGNSHRRAGADNYDNVKIPLYKGKSKNTYDLDEEKYDHLSGNIKDHWHSYEENYDTTRNITHASKYHEENYDTTRSITHASEYREENYDTTRNITHALEQPKPNNKSKEDYTLSEGTYDHLSGYSNCDHSKDT